MAHPQYDVIRDFNFSRGVTAREKIDIAHDYLFDNHPAGIPFITSWRITECKGINSAATDGQRIWYNPEWIGQLPTDAVKGIVMHEVAHILFGHHLRRGDRNPKVWNIACDLAINGHLSPYYQSLGVLHHLKSDGVAGGIFPRYGKYIHAPEGMSSEWYYQWLIDEISQRPPTPPGGFPCEDGEDGEDGGDQSDSPGDGDPGETTGNSTEGNSTEGNPTGGTSGEPGEGKGEGKGEGGQGTSGSTSTNGSTNGTSTSGESLTEQKLRTFLGKDYNDVGLGEILDDPSLTEDEDEAADKWEEQVSAAVVLQKSQGGGMGHGVDIIEKYVAKRTNISWTLLRQWVSRCSIGGYNWNRPSRRHGWRVEDVLLPNNRSKNACNGVILCDTSGSMGTEEMNEALRQIQKIISEYRNATITLVQCDRRIVEESIKTFSKYDFPLRSEHEWFGRGGTNMAPALNWVAEHRQKFDWCIMVSDMEWEVNWNPEEVPNTFIPTVYLAVNNEAVKPPHPQHHALSVKVAA